ncbi:hypothetical protein J3R82DRAFT_11137 [Butyriboletus roseoflavus]|nr:hypothetical protein J3R82DRAFT_11137 [Butyriboletus roseoflavus]
MSVPIQMDLPDNKVQTYTIYPEIEWEAHGAVLKPILLSVCFPGALPPHLVRKDVPIQVTVSLPKELTSFTAPVIDSVSCNCLLGGSDSCSFSPSDGDYEREILVPSPTNDNVDRFCDPPYEQPITFLPLPVTFDYQSSCNWEMLCKDIEAWLVTIPYSTPLRSWGRDAFWLAFIAAYPEFPHGKWPRWNSNIPLEGSFIEEWTMSSVGSTVNLSNLCQVRQQLWHDFSIHVGLFYPLPIVSPGSA